MNQEQQSFLHDIEIKRQIEIANGEHVYTYPPLYVVYEQVETVVEASSNYDQNTTLFDDSPKYSTLSEEKEEFDEDTDTDEDIKICYHDRFVTVCFTRKAAEDFITAERHNLTNPRIYVHSIERRNIQLIEIGKILGDKQ